MRRKKAKIRRRIFTFIFLFVLGFAGSNFFVNDIMPMQPHESHVLSAAENEEKAETTPVSPEISVQPVIDPDKKICYLTFDDGPSQNTEKILDILYQYNVKATFFITGHNPDCDYLISRAYREGHAIGLHTFSHNYNEIYKSTKSYYDDLQKVSDRAYRLTGKRPAIIRFPGGSSNTVSRINRGIMTTLSSEISSKGYQYFDWNVSSGDAVSGGLSRERIVKEVVNGAAGKNQICVLMHDSADKITTAEALPDIIEALKDMGYTFESLSPESFGFHHKVNN